MEWPFEDSVTAPAGWQDLAGWKQGSPEGEYVLNQHPMCTALSPTASHVDCPLSLPQPESTSSGTKGGDGRVLLLLYMTSSDPLAKISDLVL